MDCPYEGCRAHNAAFTAMQSIHIGGRNWNLFAICPNCRQGVVLIVAGKNANSPVPENCRGQTLYQNYSITRISPEPPKIALVDNVPDDVARKFSQAERLYVQEDMRGPAAIAYRATIETALKLIDPAASARVSLRDRIRAQADKMPPDLIRLLNELRFLGNDGAHEGEEPDAEDLTLGRELTRLFLIYAFDLPIRLAVAEAKRKDARDARSS